MDLSEISCVIYAGKIMDKTDLKKIEDGLRVFSTEKREEALNELIKGVETGDIEVKSTRDVVNIHCHTFYSYNGYSLSPSAIAWLAKKEGFKVTAVTDLDALDGVTEFLDASKRLGIKGCAGLESRVFIPEFAEKFINSPGELGIAYHLGMGFAKTNVPERCKPFLTRLKNGAFARSITIVKKVNNYLAPLSVEFMKDVIPLTPEGNVTERHICAAYDYKARRLFANDSAKLAEFWSEKLDLSVRDAEKIVMRPVMLQGIIRVKTMKIGGIGYTPPKPETFPSLSEMNKFTISCGAIPTVAWLSGESDAERDVENLLDIHAEYGMAAVNIVPDRNHNYRDPEVKKRKVANLHRFIESVNNRHLPIFVGTELNAPGKRIIDDFDAPAIKPYLKNFIDGAHIAYAHTHLQEQAMGYLSEWAGSNFDKIDERNEFFSAVGSKLQPHQIDQINSLDSDCEPGKVLELLG